MAAAPVPTKPPKGSGLSRKSIGGLPLWAVIVGGALAAYLAYRLYTNYEANKAAAAPAAAADTSSPVDTSSPSGASSGAPADTGSPLPTIFYGNGSSGTTVAAPDTSSPAASSPAAQAPTAQASAPATAGPAAATSAVVPSATGGFADSASGLASAGTFAANAAASGNVANISDFTAQTVPAPPLYSGSLVVPALKAPAKTPAKPKKPLVTQNTPNSPVKT